MLKRALTLTGRKKISIEPWLPNWIFESETLLQNWRIFPNWVLKYFTKKREIIFEALKQKLIIPNGKESFLLFPKWVLYKMHMFTWRIFSRLNFPTGLSTVGRKIIYWIQTVYSNRKHYCRTEYDLLVSILYTWTGYSTVGRNMISWFPNCVLEPDILL